MRSMLIAVALLAAAWVDTAQAAAVAKTDGALDVKSIAPSNVDGPGAVCARATAGADVDPKAAGPKVGPCDDFSKIGATNEKIMTTTEATELGKAQFTATGKGANGAAQVQNQNYNRETVPKKSALLPAGQAASAAMEVKAKATEQATDATSSAKQVVSSLPNTSLLTGTARALVTCSNPFLACPAGFAIGIVNDPIFFDPLPGPLADPLTLTLSSLSMEASRPHDLARLMYTFGINDDLITFWLGIDFYSLAPVIDIAQFSSKLGFATEADLEQFLRSGLSYSATAHTLTGGDLDLLTLSKIDQPTKLTFNLFAMAGVVPEPGTLALAGLGLSLLAFARRKPISARAPSVRA
jgi:hypothetical protein